MTVSPDARHEQMTLASLGSRHPFTLPPIPIPPAPPVGRAEDVAAVVAILRTPDVRLVTLTGPGGVGKTLLAQTIASAMRQHIAGGVAFVDLSVVRDPTLVLPTIAQNLSVRVSGTAGPLAGLANVLRDAHLLLVLDNLEHVAASAIELADLLTACPRLMILATSRIPLRIDGERIVPVAPLPLPNLATTEHLIDNAAVALYLQRARAAGSHLVMNDANSAAIAAICIRLEGLPLAIELAAARSKVLPPTALLARLEQRLPVPATGPRDLPARQRSMHTTIAWSYDLLSPGAQTLFRRLAVFAGGFTLDAITRAGGYPPVALDDLEELVDHSLVRRTETADGTDRYGMLETVREFARERFLAGPTESIEETHRTHATHFLDLAESASPHIPGPRQEPWLNHLQADHDNLRAALDWSIAAAPDLAIRFAGSLSFFWYLRGHLREGRDWLERALALDVPSSPSRVRALWGLGLLSHIVGEEERAIDALEEGRSLASATGDLPALSRILVTRGIVDEERGRYDDAVIRFGEALSLLRTLDDFVALGVALSHLAVATHGLGDTEGAAGFAEEALALHRRIGDEWGQAEALTLTGLIRTAVDDVDGAISVYLEALAIAERHRAELIVARCFAGLASAASARGDVGVSARLFGVIAALEQTYGFAFTALERAQHQAAIAGARRRLGDTAYQEQVASGSALPLDAALGEARKLALPAAVPLPVPLHSEPDNRFELTAREWDVLGQLIAGSTDKEIGTALGISYRTVERHVGNLCAKLGVQGRTAAVALALRQGLIPRGT